MSSRRYYRSFISDSGKRFHKPIISKSSNFKKLCNQIGIKSKKYICIYSRDSAYLSSRFPSHDYSYHNYRNSDINNLKSLSIYAARDLGYDVIRMGSKVNTKIDWTIDENVKIIDYPNSKIQNAINDIDLLSGCQIYISNGGGPESVVMAARRNFIRINVVPIGDELGFNFGLWIPKLVRRISDKKILNLIEICEFGLHDSALMSTSSKDLFGEKGFL